MAIRPETNFDRNLALELVRNGYFNAGIVRLDGGIRMPPR